MRLILGITTGALALTIPLATIAAESGKRQLEEITVTAERQEASIQDTSISITAFTGETMEQFGIRNQSDLQNFVPATTIQPYDAAVRGVGRNFRNLGGDPGIATYMNGVYSEDLYTATIGSFWDIERIEVLRGPQGTLYGRNAVGGAINFIYKGPEDTFNYSLKGIVGDYGTQDFYGFFTGPLIEDTLNGRLTFSSRKHDGWVQEFGPGPDLDSGDEQNVALQLEWFINDNMRVKLRSNQADVDRVMGGADGGGLLVLKGEDFDGTRNFESPTNNVRNARSGADESARGRLSRAEHAGADVHQPDDGRRYPGAAAGSGRPSGPGHSEPGAHQRSPGRYALRLQ
ncbi:MAG: TonB-dependent receptor [Gammaproteobacteria bacterium]|nr:TonB-dependent receptor [Gammaproteobacteria bacterium]